MKIPKFKFHIAKSNIEEYGTVSASFFNSRTHKKVTFNNSLLYLTQLKDLHKFLIKVTYRAENFEAEKNGISLSVRSVSYFDEVNKIVKEEFDKEGLEVTIKENFLILSAKEELSSLGEKIDAVESIIVNREFSRLQDGLSSVSEDVNNIGKRVAIRIVDLIQEVVNGRRIKSVKSIIKKDGVEIFAASHFLRLDHAGMNVLLGEGEQVKKYEKEVRGTVSSYNDILDKDISLSKHLLSLQRDLRRRLSQKVIYESKRIYNEIA